MMSTILVWLNQRPSALSWPTLPKVGPRCPATSCCSGTPTYDPKGYTTGPEANLLPSFWVYTVFGGQTVSDVDFARLDDDALPDVALGRLPARTSDQVSALVKKILAYEASMDTGETWRQQVLAVADGSEPSFQQDAQTFL